MAFTDALTGLANRAQFLERLDGALCHGVPVRSACSSSTWTTIKPVNDTYGHAAGDPVLVQSADQRRAGRCHARLGGAELAVLISQARSAEVEQAAAQIVEALSEGRRSQVRGQMRRQGFLPG
ncbi:diguanylate cyclase domain-containing protein [Actinoplanes xinjiangensis]|uniref:diguanylate cyclase domain-containing protein n=1 Tax=Actinoplanes xinjiangensis TaxID=512350 RepID=UPI00343091EA